MAVSCLGMAVPGCVSCTSQRSTPGSSGRLGTENETRPTGHLEPLLNSTPRMLETRFLPPPLARQAPIRPISGASLAGQLLGLPPGCTPCNAWRRLPPTTLQTNIPSTDPTEAPRRMLANGVWGQWQGLQAEPACADSIPQCTARLPCCLRSHAHCMCMHCTCTARALHVHFMCTDHGMYHGVHVVPQHVSRHAEL